MLSTLRIRDVNSVVVDVDDPFTPAAAFLWFTVTQTEVMIHRSYAAHHRM